MEYYRCEWLVIPLARPLPEDMMLDQLISQCDGKLILQPIVTTTLLPAARAAMAISTPILAPIRRKKIRY